ncbi:MAG: efflux RND transporter periplasmic adaptor subunit [Burkholderiales bacterium]
MKRSLVLWSAVFAGLVMLFAAGCGKDGDGAARAEKETHGKEEGHEDEGLVKLSDEEVARAGIRTEALAEQDLKDTINVTATVEANRERIAHVLPRIPGRVTAVSAKLGDAVKQGQLLATLESMEAADAMSAYVQALAEANVARTAYERAERLQADQIIPGKEYQRARGEYEKTRAHVAAAASKLRMLGIAPETAAKGGGPSTYPVTAPLTGTIVERKAVLGELAKNDEALFVVADLSRVWLEANIGESDLGRIRIGSAAHARVAGLPDQEFLGKVSHIGSMLDKETRTAKAIIVLDNPRGALRLQMFANVRIETGALRKVLALPESAVTLVQGLPTVFVEEAAGFEARPVELGERVGGRVTIRSGVAAGDLVATEGVYALKARLLKSQIGEGHAH